MVDKLPPNDHGISAATVLALLCYVSEGGASQDAPIDASKRANFFKALVRFQGILARAGKRTVSRQAIRLWQQKEGSPRRLSAMDFLHEYLLWTKGQKGRAEDWSKERLAAFDQLHTFFTRTRIQEAESTLEDTPLKLSALDPMVATALQALIGVSNGSSQSESSAFFRGSRTQDERDQSYYLLYRYSTNNGALVKSFLVVQKPIREIRNIHVFNHFLWSGEDVDYASCIFRECEGFIIKLTKAFYLVGYDYTVPADKRRDLEFYSRQRMLAKWTPNGMGIIAIEYDDISVNPGLFGGLTMTLAAMAQPVVARVAMLHLGTRQSLGRDVMDNVVMPREMPRADSLADDLKITVRNLREVGCRRFGLVLDDYATRSEWENSGAKNLEVRIMRMIDNTPAWEASSQKKNTRGRPTGGRGAIETYGEGRPRN